MSKPLVSVIIPTFNCKKTIEKCIKSVLSQDFPIDEYEIIIVDDCSTDGTINLLKIYKDKYPKRINVITLRSHSGPAKCRNLGVQASKARILMFTDSDCIVSKNWINNMIKPILANNAVGTVGIIYKPANNEFNNIVRYQVEDFKLYSKRNIEGHHVYTLDTRNFSILRSVFNNFRFDESFPVAGAEDVDLGIQICQKHQIIFINEEIKHFFPPYLTDYVIGEFRHGRGGYHFISKNGRSIYYQKYKKYVQVIVYPDFIKECKNLINSMFKKQGITNACFSILSELAWYMGYHYESIRIKINIILNKS